MTMETGQAFSLRYFSITSDVGGSLAAVQVVSPLPG
jgi:hypothetical protein